MGIGLYESLQPALRVLIFIFSFRVMETFPHGGRFTAPSLMKAYVAIEGDLPMPALEAQ